MDATVHKHQRSLLWFTLTVVLQQMLVGDFVALVSYGNKVFHTSFKYLAPLKEVL